MVFYDTDDVQIHNRRRREILKAHPEIQKLKGHDWHIAVPVTLSVLVQLALAAWVGSSGMGLWLLVALAWVVGGTLSHSLAISLHEITHGLVFPQLQHNLWFSIFANLPQGFPVAIQYRKYHAGHHVRLGLPCTTEHRDRTCDIDIPGHYEGHHYVHGVVRKLLWIILYTPITAIRPSLTRAIDTDTLTVVNFAVQFLFDVAVWWMWGSRALIYLMLSTVLGMGLHPISGHIFAEHYVFERITGRHRQDTYSYYGSGNWITYNVGYHVEHHDFPSIPCTRLPLLHKIAPEFYQNLPRHMSWCLILWTFITDPNMDPHSRTRRPPDVAKSTMQPSPF